MRHAQGMPIAQPNVKRPEGPGVQSSSHIVRYHTFIIAGARHRLKPIAQAMPLAYL